MATGKLALVWNDYQLDQT